MVRYLLKVAAVYLGAIGAALLVVPVQFGSGAVPSDASPELVSLLRLLGGPLVGIAVLNWITPTADERYPLKPVLVANLLGFGLVAGNDVVGVLTGDARELARVFLPLHLAFAVSFALALMGGLPNASPRDRS